MYRYPMIACLFAGLLFLTGLWLLPAAIGQPALRNEVSWVGTRVQPSDDMRKTALQFAQRNLPSAVPTQVAFVQIRASSPHHRVPVATFYGWRMQYAGAQIGSAAKVDLTLLLNSDAPVVDGWPPYGLVAILADRSAPPLPP